MVTYPLGVLARAIDARLQGDPSFEVSGVAGLEEAGPRDLSFLANPRYREAATRSSAGAIVTGVDDPIDVGNLLRCDNPYLGFARAVELLAPAERPSPGVHAAAVVDPSVQVPADASVGPMAVVEGGVELGAGVVIGAGTIVEAGVVIGEGTRLFPRVTVHSGTRIGRRCIVQSGSVIGSDGFGYAMDAEGRHHAVPQRGRVEIGDEVDIGACVTVARGSSGATVIGSGTKIDNLVQVAHNVQIGRNSIIVSQVGIAGSTRIGDQAMIGGQAGIVGHLTFGDRVQIAAGSGVMHDLPSGAKVSGYIAVPHRQNMKIQSLLLRLPELFKRVKALEDGPRDS